MEKTVKTIVNTYYGREYVVKQYENDIFSCSIELGGRTIHTSGTFGHVTQFINQKIREQFNKTGTTL